MAVKHKTIVPVAIDNDKLPELTEYASSIKKSRAHVIRLAVTQYMNKVRRNKL